MCSKFQLQKTTMENNYQGDLADIFLGSSGPNSITTTSDEPSSTFATAAAVVTDGWLGQFPSHPINYSASGIEESSVQDFGDPFCNLRDPLFNDLDMMSASSNLFTSNKDNNNNNNNNISLFGPKILEETEMKSRSTGNIFSRMLQISPITKLAAAMSPCNSPMTDAVALQPPSTVIAGGGALVANDAIISPNSSKTCLVENSGLQISSPRNTGIKRRKSQAKKVVCIPAPAPANSRQGGEIVPSDLWAWRKYGQKPIKGSPYPRGYYRCSSSKGCSARKQVERSRTDPNMLVITYTSEHNHPWPTQRNALAGSTRSQLNNSKHTTTSTSKNNTNSKDDEQNTSTTVAQVNIPKVKEEVAELQDLRHNRHHNQQLAVEMRDVEFSKDSYQPILPDSSSNNSHEDFFADLVELEADPLNLLFAKTLSEDINEAGQKKAIDAFNLYDWSGNNNNKSEADP